MGQSTFIQQYRLLLWKNCVLKIRRPIATLVEILLPLAVIMILMFVRNLQLVYRMDRCYLREKLQDSLGPLPFVRDFICTFNSTCYNKTQINWTDTSSNDFLTFLSNITTVVSSLPQGNLTLPVLLLWSINNPTEVQTLTYSLSYISAAYAPLGAGFSQMSSNNSNSSSAGLTSVSSFICGSSENDFMSFFGGLMSYQRSRRKRYSATCQSQLYDSMSSSTFGEQIYQTLAPILFGRIYYTPVTNLTQQLMKRANLSFVILDNLRLASVEWRLTFRAWALQQLLNSSSTDNLRNQSNQCLQRNVSQFTPTCRAISNLLDPTNITSIINTLTTIFSFLETTLNCTELNKFVGVENETFIDNLIEGPLTNVFAGLVLDPSFKYLTRENATFLNYSIRMPTNRVDSTTNFKVLDRFWTPQPRISTLRDMKYYSSGFLMLQEALERAFVEVVVGNYTVNIGSSIQIMPTPCYVIDNFIRFASSLMPFFLLISWSPIYTILVKSIVYEKEKRLKEFMLVMGLSNSVHWMAWFTTSVITVIIPCVGSAFVLKYRQILQFSSPGVLFILLFSYAISFITQAFMLSAFFSKANIAAVVSLLLYFIFYVPFLVLINVQDDVSYSAYMGSSILAQVSFCNAINFIAYWEQSMVGAQFDNLFSSTVLNLNFGVGHCIVMLWVDTVVYFVITWYLEAVFPGQYGIPKPWYFFIQRNYWFSNACRNASSSANEPEDLSIINWKKNIGPGMEEVPPDSKIGISIQNLTKVFSKASVPSVDELNLDFYKGQITAFLGHNGAGKTTTISMLTGIFPPTSGAAFILKYDITKDIDSIRKFLGFCPQHNILFDNLTVEDHIYFYGLLKGMPLRDIRSTIPGIVEEVGLTKKLKTQSKSLSGGMKRKLSVAMAFIGGSKVIFLDEPTAGVDPFARRGIWDLLINYRGEDKTIILTTHHMDEADYLSDRIAIISQGKLRCTGSSVFLKREFGEGYYLILAKSEDAQMEEFDDDNHSRSGLNLYKFIQTHIEDAKFAEETKTQWNFILPLTGIGNGGFSSLFKGLDSSLKMLNISTYGLCDASLEDVFLKVAQDPSNVDKEDDSVEVAASETLTSEGDLPRPVSRSSLKDRSDLFRSYISKRAYQAIDSNLNYNLLSGLSLFRQQVLGLQIKRFHYTKRNIKGFVAEMVLPVLMVVGIVAVLQFTNPMSNQPPMTIHPWLMMPGGRLTNMKTFYRMENSSDNDVNLLTKGYRSDLGESGVRCMNSSVYSLNKLVCYLTAGNQWSPGPRGAIPLQTPECDCNTTGSQICSDPLSGGPPNSYRYMASSDILYNLTGYNISDNLIKGFAAYSQKQYGGFQFLLPSNFGLACKAIGNISLWTLVRDSVVVDPNSTSNPNNFLNYMQRFFQLSGIRTNYSRIWVNNKGYVSMPAYANIFDNLLLRARLKSSVNPNNYGMVVTTYPFKYSQADILSLVSSQSFLQVSLSNFVILALSLIPSSFVIFLIEERVSGSKRQQFVSGVNPYVYWVSNFFWDFFKYLLSAFLIVLVFVAFGYQSYIGTKNAGAFISILTLYGLAIIPHMYPFSYIISTPSTAFVVLSAYNMFVGSITTITTFFLDQLQSSEITLKPINDALKKFFLVFPQYCLGRSMMDISFQYLAFNVTNGTKDYNPFSWDLTGKNLTALVVLFTFWSSVILVVESGVINRTLCGKVRKNDLKEKEIVTNEDDDVVSERDRIKADTMGKDVLKVEDLTKIYNAGLNCKPKCYKKKLSSPTYEEKRKLAVNNISFGVKPGECFGLLGVNGAGKTTTFKMLTGEEVITKGEATINGFSIVNSMVSAHRNMGFCPQFDALHALLTCEEEMYFYCRIRGIEESLIKSSVERIFKNLSLSPHASKQTHSLSGGNKRKLSTAISLVGSPTVIFMDEPTSGMDAGARRFLWNAIKKLTNQQKAVVLTSHNMEECEVLCHRLAIMVNGQFQCLGSVQHLKSKFGDDYYVTLRMHSNCDSTGDRDKIKDIMSKEFETGVFLKDENFVTLQYRMDPSVSKLYMIFEFFENLKASKMIVDYSVCQTTLDEIFINFAKKCGMSAVVPPAETSSALDDNAFTNPTFDKSEL